MALGTPTALANGGDTDTDVTSGSFTPTANALIIVHCAARKSGTGAPNLPTITDTASLSWTVIDSVQYDDGSNPRVTARMWYAVAPSSPSSMTVTVTSSNAAGIGVNVIEITGADTTFTNTATGTNSAGDPSATLPNTPAGTSLVISVANTGGTGAMGNPTGFTEISDFQPGTMQGRMACAYDNTSPTAGPHGWTSTATRAVTILAEVFEGSSLVNFDYTGDVDIFQDVAGNRINQLVRTEEVNAFADVAGNRINSLVRTEEVDTFADVAGNRINSLVRTEEVDTFADVAGNKISNLVRVADVDVYFITAADSSFDPGGADLIDFHHTGDVDAFSDVAGNRVSSLVRTGEVDIFQDVAGNRVSSLVRTGEVDIFQDVAGNRVSSLVRTGDVDAFTITDGWQSVSRSHIADVSVWHDVAGEVQKWWVAPVSTDVYPEPIVTEQHQLLQSAESDVYFDPEGTVRFVPATAEETTPPNNVGIPIIWKSWVKGVSDVYRINGQATIVVSPGAEVHVRYAPILIDKLPLPEPPPPSSPAGRLKVFPFQVDMARIEDEELIEHLL